jgi:hypothetical protein
LMLRRAEVRCVSAQNRIRTKINKSSVPSRDDHA